MRRNRRTKIVATLGPATAREDVIERLFFAGVDVFRLNLSHGSHEIHRRLYASIRNVERRVGRPIAVLLDLQGPKIRIGKINGGRLDVLAGQRMRFELNAELGKEGCVPLPHPEIFESLQPGDSLLVDDGKLRFQVEECDSDNLLCVATVGGVLTDRKGVNVPGRLLPIAALTEKDRCDLAFGLDLGVDWVAQSFVQTTGDVLELQKLVLGRAAIMVKIEKPAAMQSLRDIVQIADGVMVARGDLGVEMATEDVPRAQREIVRECRRQGKPVVVATQMLESMIGNPTPTRAETSDVATAVYSGADAVMLSAESASGSYPVEAVEIMSRIIASTERDPFYRRIMDADHCAPERPNAADAIATALRSVNDQLPITVNVAFTESGATSLRVARERPIAPILSLSPSIATARRMAIAWGVHSLQAPDAHNVEDMFERTSQISHQEGFAEKDKPFVMVAGVPFGVPGTTNLLRIAWS